MRSRIQTSEAEHTHGRPPILLLSGAAGLLVTGVAIFAQWLIYSDWLHDRGPLRMFGSILAGALTFAFSYHLQEISRQRELEAIRRAEAMRSAHDRVRNSLQTIECLTYAQDPHSTEPVRHAVAQIEKALQQAIVGTTGLPPQSAGRARETREIESR